MPDLVKKASDSSQKPNEETKKAPSMSPTCYRNFALEMWVQVRDGPNAYNAPEEDTISADFVVDTLNLFYPGCTGIHLSQASHMVGL